MTAEISVMNKLAVSMAADSAVTVIGKKVYNTGSKLFPVSHDLAMGIMFYGNAQLLGVPWETIVAAFRTDIGDRQFKTVEDCGKEFLSFLSKAKHIFPDATQKKYFIDFTRSILGTFLNSINKQVGDHIAKNGKITTEEVSKIIDQVLVPEFQKWGKAGFVEQIAEGDRKNLLENFKTDFEAIIKEVFKDLPITDETKAKLPELCADFASKDLLFNAHKSGVVFCGFGTDERYPSLFSVEMEFVVNGKVKHLKPNIFQITDENPASIHPFAQQDVVFSFLRGIDPKFLQLLDGYFSNFFNEATKSILANLGTQQPSQELTQLLESFKTQAGPNLLKQLDMVSQNEFVNPVIIAAQILSKDDLAHMAETLVSLTSFRRKISLDLETVGGPVDVAVISKKDGFVWIKRKHYFNSELNPQFFRRYNVEKGQ